MVIEYQVLLCLCGCLGEICVEYSTRNMDLGVESVAMQIALVDPLRPLPGHFSGMCGGFGNLWALSITNSW